MSTLGPAHNEIQSWRLFLFFFFLTTQTSVRARSSWVALLSTQFFASFAPFQRLETAGPVWSVKSDRYRDATLRSRCLRASGMQLSVLFWVGDVPLSSAFGCLTWWSFSGLSLFLILSRKSSSTSGCPQLLLVASSATTLPLDLFLKFSSTSGCPQLLHRRNRVPPSGVEQG